MFKKEVAILSFCCLSSVCLNAYADIQTLSQHITYPSAFLVVGSGASFSRKADISASPILWDLAEQGYNQKLGTSELYTVGFGYQFDCFWNADIEFTYRPSFHYSRYQTPLPNPNTPGFLGTKTRKFKLDNASIMVNVGVNGAAFNWMFNLFHDQFTLFPIAGAGLGIAYNTVWDFHSVRLVQTTPGFEDVASIENPYRRKAFAWQVFLGLELTYCKSWAFDFGYRYFNGGRFKSNNYVASVPVGSLQPRQTLPWHGKLTANELFLNLKYNFG